ncbi:hypothetical protein G6F48_009178 [Rhizopus delemar]|nr:hypothetical protein G6F48_009178 [Rhizopus delemar]
MHGESASVDISSVNIQNELRKIKELLGPYDPADIMSFDETGIIDNFKAHFRAQQYDRALCLYITNAWLKVKPETVNGMLPDLPRNFDNKVADVSQWNLEAVESEMIVCYTTSTTNNEETAEGNIDETEENDNTEQDKQCVDIVECKKRLREAYETILMYEVSLDDLDRKLHRRIRMKLANSCAELNKSKEQTDLRSYFTNGKTFCVAPINRRVGIISNKERYEIKMEIISLYKNADRKDTFALDILLNCLNKLPDFESDAPVGEMELITNFLDPVFSPVFHSPQKKIALKWLNRNETNTSASRPNGVFSSTSYKHSGAVASGYCEVKPSDVNDFHLVYKDLYRLAMFSKTMLERKSYQMVICVQAVVLKEIERLYDMLPKIDNLKQLCELYYTCDSQYKHEIPQAHVDDFTDLINPKKKRKSSKNHITLSFN